MACMANITSQKAGFLGSQYLQMLNPLTPLGAYAAPRPPARLVTPHHLKITCLNKRKQEP